MAKSEQAIVIIHHRQGDGKWLIPLLESIETDYPLLITNHNGPDWCMGAIQQTWERTGYKELLFMNETMLVKDNAIWDIVFKQYKGHSVMLGDRFLMFFGKFRRPMVNQLQFPVVKDKVDDVLKGEGQWCRQYMELNDHVAIEPLADGDTTDESRFVMMHGRRNLVLENRYFIKYKQSYNMETLLANG